MSPTVLHDERLEDADQQEDLCEAGAGDGVGPDDGGRPVGKGVEAVPVQVDAARQVEAGARREVADEGEHGDAPVLELHIAEPLELLPVAVRAEVERVVEAEGGLRADLLLERTEGGGGGGLLRRGEGGGGSQEQG